MDLTPSVLRILRCGHRSSERALITAQLAHKLVDFHRLTEPFALRTAETMIGKVLDIGLDGFAAIESALGAEASA